MTVSKMANWPAVSVPIMMQRAVRPCVHSLKMPVSATILPRRDIIGPSPPAPDLLICAGTMRGRESGRV
jgi:hypothetical protein